MHEVSKLLWCFCLLTESYEHNKPLALALPKKRGARSNYYLCYHC